VQPELVYVAADSAVLDAVPTIVVATDIPTDIATDVATDTPPTVVFVEAPKLPREQGARGVGAAVTVLATALFTVTYGLLVLLLALLASPTGASEALRFFSSITFWLPVVVFALAHLLLVVVANRAGWWAHVFGGFFVALVVWVGFVGAVFIATNTVGASSTAVGAIVLQQLTNPLGFAAAIAAREVPIWVGGIVARRGRSARVRNAEAKVAHEQRLADHRAALQVQTGV
jgi:hypothetical protein